MDDSTGSDALNQTVVEPHSPVAPAMDADINGRLATALFIGVILILLVLIYALASAA